MEAAQPADRQAEAILWFIEHPEALDAMKDRLLQAYIRHIKRKVEELERQEAAASCNAGGNHGKI